MKENIKNLEKRIDKIEELMGKTEVTLEKKIEDKFSNFEKKLENKFEDKFSNFEKKLENKFEDFISIINNFMKEIKKPSETIEKQ